VPAARLSGRQKLVEDLRARRRRQLRGQPAEQELGNGERVGDRLERCSPVQLKKPSRRRRA
ncbi:MAG TPA: hypothetical protein VNL94_03640, partial [Candidatus Binatia bacterium]|nr:hypothetical protein [Candidatus Binatia bacterium]